jgi:DNA-binding MarR family transcriptional regulator
MARVSQGEVLGREFSEAVVMFHEAVARRLGMSAAEWKCLDLLVRGGATTAKSLAEKSGLTTGAITGIVDRLENARYVKRERNPEDRRSVIIKPLPRPDLADELTPIFSSLGRAMGKMMGRYRERDLALIEEFFKDTAVVLRQQTAKLLTER